MNTMKKHWKVVTDEADKLLVVGVTDNDNDLILVGGRLRATALLAALEPAPETLPPVRPLSNKPRKAPKRAKTLTEKLALEEQVWGNACPDCGVGPGEPCVSLRSTSTRRIGEVLTSVHAKRGNGSRSIPNKPPAWAQQRDTANPLIPRVSTG